MTHRLSRGMSVLDSVGGDQYDDDIIFAPGVERYYERSWTARTKSFLLRAWKRLWNENWLFLIVLGVVGALTCWAVDLGIVYVLRGQRLFSGLSSIYAVQWILYVLYALVFALIAVSAVQWISTDAGGSGIPEMRCILSGIDMPHYLSMRTLVAKIIGLLGAYGGGFHIGKEGPYVHIISAVGTQLTRLPWWRNIKKNDAVRQQMLAVACALGVVCAFGAPIGGVLFSVEVTTSFYLVDNLWRAFFCAVVGSIVLQVTHETGLVQLFNPPYDLSSYTTLELFSFALLGIIAGLLGAVFVQLLLGTYKLGRSWKGFQTKKGAYFKVMMVSMILSAIAFPTTFRLLRNDAQCIIDSLIGIEGQTRTNCSNNRPDDFWIELIILFFAKVIFTVTSVGFTGLPVGVFAPAFISGAVLGRLMAELMVVLFPAIKAAGLDSTAAPIPDMVPMAPSPLPLHLVYSRYAIVGAAAMSAGVTRTVSTAVIMIELTKQVTLMLPILIAVLEAIVISRLFADSVYDVMIRQKDLPAMPRFKLYKNSYNKGAAEIMKTNLSYLTISSTYQDAIDLLEKSSHQSFPLVSAEDFVFLGSVRRQSIETLIQSAGLPVPARPNKSAKRQNVSTMTSAELLTRPGQDDQNGNMLLDSDDDDDFDVRGSGDDDGNGAGTGENDFDTGEIQIDREALIDTLDILTQPIPYIFKSNDREFSDRAVVEVDPAAFQISDQMSLHRVHFLFAMLGMNHVFVTSRGRLRGVVTKKLLIKKMNDIKVKKSGKSLL
mmetsp:Transcript_21553/g.24056  ORF Transcript_21553/g.24056 Transcript_21553/m.24056 type:complete len:770 (+) Transcript_21553:36-2345(+)